MKWYHIAVLMTLMAILTLGNGCYTSGGGGSDKKKENRIYSHKIYRNLAPWDELTQVPVACDVNPNDWTAVSQVEFKLRFEFEKFDADTYGFWLQPFSVNSFKEVEPQFYELSPASVGITLYLSENVEVDVWLEMEDGSLSDVYTFSIEVDGQCMVEKEICRPVSEEEV